MESSQHYSGDRRPLAGRRVAITGRLASLNRDAARDVLSRIGATYSDSVTRGTSLLIVGEGSWPLSRQGRLTQKLQTARRLSRAGCGIEIISEDEFLDLLDDSVRDDAPRRLYSPVELARAAGVPPSRLQNWVAAGLIAPVETRAGVPRFDFRQVSRAKALVELNRSGVPLTRIRRSLEMVRGRLGWVDETVDRLATLRQQGGRLVLEGPRGELLEPSGQLVFDFRDGENIQTVAFQQRASADDLFQRAVREEDAGDWSAAADAYRRLLELEGPDADLCFNLANVLCQLSETAAGIERYRQCIELDPEYVEAWHNLGNAYTTAGRPDLAVAALRRAIDIDPDYADAHYCLADTLDELGLLDESRAHWKAFLQKEATGEWADYARRRLAAIGDETG